LMNTLLATWHLLPVIFFRSFSANSSLQWDGRMGMNPLLASYLGRRLASFGRVGSQPRLDVRRADCDRLCAGLLFANQSHPLKGTPYLEPLLFLPAPKTFTAQRNQSQSLYPDQGPLEGDGNEEISADLEEEIGNEVQRLAGISPIPSKFHLSLVFFQEPPSNIFLLTSSF
jgi:hypothetical protein